MRTRPVAIAAAVLVGTGALVQLVGVVAHAARGDDGGAAAGMAAVPALLRAPAPAERDLSAYAGAGAWVDLYDIGGDAGRPPVVPADVGAMADAGVRTLYLQVARDDQDGHAGLHDPGLAARFLVRAHERGLRVVGWYVPRFGDVGRDLDHLRAIADFDALGHRFDGVAVDIEWTETVADDAERSARLLELSRGLRDHVGSDALGAIVLPPVQLEVVNPAYWPRFPWAELAPLYDAWLPMGYWTDRTAASGWRDAAAYTSENLQRLGDHLGDEAPVHAIGGLGAETSLSDLAGFLGVVEDEGAIGASIYDWATFPTPAQRELA
ncbi:MAG TPA: hypothetical protein VF015_01030, partial [Acidimicrobiales bacterium]